MCAFKFPTRSRWGQQPPFHRGLPASVTWVIIQRTIHNDGVIIHEFVDLSWDEPTEYCWSTVTSNRHYVPFHYVCSNDL
jgi:hypothetical protein